MQTELYVIKYKGKDEFLTKRCRYWSLDTTTDFNKVRYYSKKAHAVSSIEASVPKEFRAFCEVKKVICTFTIEEA
jgi:hypothetical protein